MKFLRTILFTLNLILAVGLILTTLAGTVRPSTTLLPSVLAYGYLPLLAANVLMVLLWLLMKRWEALLSVAVIALRWGMVGMFFQLGGTTKVPAAEDHPSMVTLMSYNVHMFYGQGDYHPEKKDSIAAEFLSLVREHRPDVLCLQEYQDYKPLVDSLVQDGYNHYYGTHTASGGRPSGTVVFSRLPISYVSRIDNRKLMVELLQEGQRLRVCCVHMDSYQFDNKDREELERMRHGEVQQSSRKTLGKVKETILSHEEEWEQGALEDERHRPPRRERARHEVGLERGDVVHDDDRRAAAERVERAEALHVDRPAELLDEGEDHVRAAGDGDLVEAGAAAGAEEAGVDAEHAGLEERRGDPGGERTAAGGGGRLVGAGLAEDAEEVFGGHRKGISGTRSRR